MTEIAFEFRLNRIRHSDDPEHLAVGWMMEAVGKVDGIGHCIRSLPLATYPAKRQISMFFTRSTRDLREWFDGPEGAAARVRVASRRPSLIVVPGR